MANSEKKGTSIAAEAIERYGKCLELIGISDEIGLAVNLNHDADAASVMGIGLNLAFEGGAPRLFFGLSQALFGQIDFGLLEIAIVFLPSHAIPDLIARSLSDIG